VTEKLLAISVLLLCALAAPAETEHPPFSLMTPPGLAQPQLSRTLTGETWAYLATQRGQPTRLLITVMAATDVENLLGTFSDVRCVNLFVDELRRQYDDFFVIEMKRPLALGPSELPQFRWTGRRVSSMLTGVLSCGQLADRYYIIDFVDELQNASHSFPGVRRALRSFSAAPR